MAVVPRLPLTPLCPQWAQDLVDQGYYAADLFLGLTLFAFLFILSLLRIVQSVQTTLLFNFEFVRESKTAGLKNMLLKLRRNAAKDEAQQDLGASTAAKKGM